ncbi:hypothetical protein [Yinghuangia seranimata]|uniref:hypothetical protein n=1 Tax=Yinghuangia seranimata TaxID=408067 RepID=UPI00248CB6C4|nr:hypothetical protein [Yinghuangia seranimata]MDI2127568.1 hypothetical protein [Yinghuangia seranimata]
MPGSVTVSHHPHAASIEHGDAERLVWLLAELGLLINEQGDNRLSDAQVGLLSGAQSEPREEFAAWVRHVTADLSGQLHHGLGTA